MHELKFISITIVSHTLCGRNSEPKNCRKLINSITSPPVEQLLIMYSFSKKYIISHNIDSKLRMRYWSMNKGSLHDLKKIV